MASLPTTPCSIYVMSSEALDQTGESQGQSKLLVVAVVVVAILVTAYFALVMPGMDHSGPDGPVDHEQMDM